MPLPNNAAVLFSLADAEVSDAAPTFFAGCHFYAALFAMLTIPAMAISRPLPPYRYFDLRYAAAAAAFRCSPRPLRRYLFS
jgi:hypothetical protein